MREVCCEPGMGWLREAAVPWWEMGWDWSPPVFKGRRKGFCVIKWTTGCGSALDGNCVRVTYGKTNLARMRESSVAGV